MNPLPANSIAYVKPDQTAKKQPSEGFLDNINVVGPDSVAQYLVIDGDKPFYIPTDFTAENISFTKSGEGYQALLLPFSTWSGLGVVNEDGSIDPTPETFVAGEPVVFKDNVNIAENASRTVNAGTFAETESGYIYNPNGEGSLIYAENISPFTYVWASENPNGIDGPKSLTPSLSKGEGTVYDLAGRKIANGQKPTAKGLYIHNGKKILKQ